MKRAVRFLVLACSLILALPHGWCCLLANELASMTRVKSPDCCHQQSQPCDEKPAQLPPDRCPCFERQTVLSHSVEQAKAEVGYFAILTEPETAPSVIAIVAEAFSPVHPPTNRLHVFKCVWRC